MALIDKASLLMVPSTYEAGKLYNVLPSGNRAPDSTDQNSGYDQTRADFDFDRGSNAAATRINSSGLIEKYRENLLLQSNQFDTTWVLGSSTITSGQSGYDGTNNAWLLTKTAASGNMYQGKSYSGVNTFSIYAKGNTTDWIRLRNTGGYVYFDITNGVVGGNISAISPKITSVGNGWYKCEVAWNGTGTITQVFVADSDGSTSGSSGSIYIQSAQLESGLVASSYLESTSVTGKAGVLVDLPRINYDANGENGALLLEPSRANLVTQSEYFGSAWTLQNVSVTQNSAISPEGLANASKLIPNTTSGLHRLRSNTVSIATNGAYSAFVKADGYSKIALREDNAVGHYASFDLSAGSVLDENASGIADIDDYGNGWYRIYFDDNAVSSVCQLSFYVLPDSYTSGSPTATNWAADGTKGILIFGAQAESNASYPSSYIPTMGTSQTRAADIVDGKEDSALYNDIEGVLFVEFSALSATRDNEFRFMISNGTNDERLQIGLQTSGNLYASVITGNSATASFNYTLPNPTQTHKVAIKYKANDCALWVDGIERGTDISATMPSGLDVFDFYRTPNNNNYVEANVKQVIYFNEALSDSELATLTTL